MKDSGIEWVGQIPEDWNVKKGKYCFAQTNDRGNNKSLVLLSPTQNYGVIPQELYEQLSGFNAVKLNEKTDLNLLKTVHKGAYVISLRSFQGGFEYSEYEGVVSPAYQVFYPTIKIDDRFYKYLFKTQVFIDKMNSYTMSLRDGKNIAFADFGRTYIPIPPVEYQMIVADFLDRKCSEIDSLRADIEAEIENLEEYKKSVITEAVTKGLDKNAPMKDSGVEWVERIPSTWKTTKVKYLFNSGKGLGITKDNLIDEGLPVISYGQIHSKDNDGVSLAPQLLRFVDCSYKRLFPQCEVEKYDFVFADTSEDYDGCGNCVYKRNDNVVFGGYHSIVLHSKYKKDNRFLAYLFLTDDWRKQIRSYVSGVKVFSVTNKLIMNTSVVLPPEEEQRIISDYLDMKCKEINEIIQARKEQIEIFAEYKKSLIYEYVTGKKEVPNE